MTTKSTQPRAAHLGSAKAQATRLVAAAFPPGRTRRSTEYVAGMTATVVFRLTGKHAGCPYDAGTCQADAFLAGVDEGKTLSIDEGEK